MLDLADIKAEFGKNLVGFNLQVKDWIYRDSELSKYATSMTRINGEYRSMTAVMDHVVQEFKSVWNALGSTKVIPRKLESYHQKVNYEFVPADVLGTWMAHLYR